MCFPPCGARSPMGAVYFLQGGRQPRTGGRRCTQASRCFLISGTAFSRRPCRMFFVLFYTVTCQYCLSFHFPVRSLWGKECIPFFGCTRVSMHRKGKNVWGVRNMRASGKGPGWWKLPPADPRGARNRPLQVQTSETMPCGWSNCGKEKGYLRWTWAKQCVTWQSGGGNHQQKNEQK